MVSILDRVKDWWSPKNGDGASELDSHSELYNKILERNMFAAYDGARTTPQNERFWSAADHLSPRSAVRMDKRRTLRSRSRYECIESNSYARGMVLTKVGDVIGTGPRLQVTTDKAEFNAKIEKEFAAWCKAVNLPSKLRTMCQAKVVDGEAFAERITNRTLSSPVKLDLRLSEADLWTNQWFERIDEPNEHDGILYDNAGNAVNYKRLRYHPGDDHAYANELNPDDLNPDDVIHWYRVDRPDQKRGIPEFSPALPLFAELRRWIMATIAAAESAAEFAAIVESTANQFSENPDQVEKGFTLPINRRAMAFMPRGWTMKQFDARHPNAQFDIFEEKILQQIARCLLMPLNIASGSSRKHNFASGRLDYLLWWNQCDIDRHDCEIVVLDRVFNWWIEEARLINDYLPPMSRTVEHRWFFPKRKPIDEVAHAKSHEIMWHMGHASDDDILAEQSTDPDEHYDKLRRQTEKRKAIDENFPQPGIQMSESIMDEDMQPAGASDE